MHPMNKGCVVVEEVGGCKILHDPTKRGAPASVLEEVKGMTTAHVRGPLLDRVGCLFKVLETLPTGIVCLRVDGITVEEFALPWWCPKETDPMLSWQVDGIGIGNSTLRIQALTRDFVGTVHVCVILANDGITLTSYSQGVGVMHPLTRLPRESGLA